MTTNKTKGNTDDVRPSKADAETQRTDDTPPAPKPRKKRKSKYLDKAELLEEVLKSRDNNMQMTDRLATMLQTLTRKYSQSPKFRRYTYNEDMQAYAMMMLIRTWKAFNPEKSNQPFSYYTQCIHHSFIQFLNQEKKQRNIRDELLVKKGLMPSYSYQMEHGSEIGPGGTLLDPEHCGTSDEQEVEAKDRVQEDESKSSGNDMLSY